MKPHYLHTGFKIMDYLYGVILDNSKQAEQEIFHKSQQAYISVYLNILLESSISVASVQYPPLFREFIITNPLFDTLNQIHHNFIFFHGHSSLFTSNELFEEFLASSILDKWMNSQTTRSHGLYGL